MHSLFLKIFLWFWLAMAVVAGALVVSVISTRGPTGPERAREFADNIGHAAAVDQVNHTYPCPLSINKQIEK